MSPALLRRQLAHRLQRLGLPGLCGLLLLALAVGYGVAVLLPARARSQQLEQQIARLQRPRAAAAQRPATPTEQLSAFYGAFPRGGTIPDWLDKIYGIADQQKLDLDVGEYSLAQARAGRLDEFRIVFPVKGSYPQIRAFIGAALATAPALALDSLILKREKVSDGRIEARITFRLYLEKAS